MKKIVALLLVIPFIALSQNNKKYPTLLWKISGGGLSKPSYLYGTMHVSNKVAYHLSDQFFDALKSVDVVGLETNPGEWLQNMELTGELSQLNQFSNPYNYGKDFYRNSFSVTKIDKKMLQGILSYDPDIINGLLYRHNRSRENFEENTYIDLFIFQAASKLNKKVISLEDFVQSEIYARLSSLPDKETSDSAEFQNNYKDFYINSQKIEDSYRNGDLDQLDSISKLTSTKNTQRFLINERNFAFVRTIDSVLKTKTLFSGVGAAHLPGEMGVIELLRKKGYKVEPVIPKLSKKADVAKDELDAMVKPVSFQKQYPIDSTYTVMLPGKLSQIVNLENVSYNLYADMVNGSFYTIVRVKTHGPLAHATPQLLKERVDSLLFEYVPGKILSKKEITSNNGMIGYDILNKTRRGDEQHYQIFFGDMDLYLFKLGGKNNYASGNEAKQFFSSINFINKSENLVLFSPKTKGFSVKIPSNYEYVKNDGSSYSGLVEDLVAYSKTSKKYYGIKQAVYNDFNYLEEDTFELNLLAKNTLKNFEFKNNIKYELQKINNLPSIKFSGTNTKNDNFVGTIVIKGIHYYLQYLISPNQINHQDEFFTSFKITNYEHINPIKEITDEDAYFKVKDEVSESTLSKFNENYVKQYKAIKTAKKIDNYEYDYKSANKTYYSPSSNEYVNIFFEKYNDYDFKTTKDFEESFIRNVKNAGLLAAKVKTSGAANSLTCTITAKDTATSKALDLKIFVKNGCLYEISAPYDTTLGYSGWTKSFMESFTPKDTVIGKNIFENKFKNLLIDVTSTDTTVKKRANSSLLNSLTFKKEYNNDFVDFIKSNKLSLVSEEARAQLFVNGGTTNNEAIIEPYKNIYKQYTDSFYLQLCVLKGLGYLKTPKSYNAFLGLVTSEAPLVGEAGIVNDVFSVLNDSLELCKNFFPSMYSLTKFDEYKNATYTLLANLTKKKIITTTNYLTQKENILADANLALKRYNSSNKSTSNKEYGDFEHLGNVEKEIAEALKVSVENMANNSMYKSNNDYLTTLDSYARPELVNYAIILAPFYKTDEKVKLFFTKLSKLKAQNIIMPSMIELLKQNVQLNDTLLKYYCKNKTTRAYFYSELEKEKLTEQFDKSYSSQQAIVESILQSQKQLTNYMSYEKDKSKREELVFVKTLDAKNKYQTGKIYIYKQAKYKNDDEGWALAFVANTKKGEINSNVEVLNVNYSLDKTKTVTEMENEILEDFSLLFRKRAIATSQGNYYDEGGYEY